MYEVKKKNNQTDNDNKTLPGDWAMYEKKKKYSFMTTLSEKDGSLAFDIIIIAVTLILSAFLIYTTVVSYSKYNEMQNNIKEQIALKESFEEDLEYLQELEDNEKALTESDAAWSQTLPKTAQKERIVEFSNSIINQSGATFTDLRFGTEKKQDSGVVEVPFNIKMECTFNQLLDVLDNYYSEYRLINIDKISMIRDNNQGGIADVEISAICYYK